MSAEHTPAGPARLTPMMRQYLEVKQAHPDCILLFRLGDFYEMFFEDAEIASRVLEITLTSRDKGDERGAHVRGAVARGPGLHRRAWWTAGHKVAICDQVEDAGQAKGLVRREVVQVVTPGTGHRHGDARGPARPSTCSPWPRGAALLGFAYADVTTGEFRAGRGAATGQRLAEEAGAHRAPGGAGARRARPRCPGGVLPPGPRRHAGPDAEAFRGPQRAGEALRAHLGVADLGGVRRRRPAPRACARPGPCLAYVEANYAGGLATPAAPGTATPATSP